MKNFYNKEQRYLEKRNKKRRNKIIITPNKIQKELTEKEKNKLVKKMKLNLYLKKLI